MIFRARRRSPRDGSWAWIETAWETLEAAWEGTRSFRVSEEPAAALEIYECVRTWRDYSPFDLNEAAKRERQP